MKMKKAIALLLTIALLLCGCARGTQTLETEPTIQTTVPTEETQAPTEEVTEPSEMEPPTEEVTEPTEPPFQNHSGIREDGSFGRGALFIGDSLTYGLVLQYLTIHDLLGDARYMAIVGMPVANFFIPQTLRHDANSTCTYSSEFYGKNYADAVEAAGEEVTAVYYMMGTNYDADCDAETYIGIMDHILEKCPNATIYLQLVPVCHMDYIPYDQINEIIRQVYAYYQVQENPRVMLIDTFTAIGDNLSDGIHLTLEGQENWYQALVDFAEENKIPE